MIIRLQGGKTNITNTDYHLLVMKIDMNVIETETAQVIEIGTGNEDIKIPKNHHTTAVPIVTGTMVPQVVAITDRHLTNRVPMAQPSMTITQPRVKEHLVMTAGEDQVDLMVLSLQVDMEIEVGIDSAAPPQNEIEGQVRI